MLEIPTPAQSKASRSSSTVPPPVHGSKGVGCWKFSTLLNEKPRGRLPPSRQCLAPGRKITLGLFLPSIFDLSTAFTPITTTMPPHLTGLTRKFSTLLNQKPRGRLPLFRQCLAPGRKITLGLILPSIFNLSTAFTPIATTMPPPLTGLTPTTIPPSVVVVVARRCSSAPLPSTARTPPESDLPPETRTRGCSCSSASPGRCS